MRVHVMIQYWGYKEDQNSVMVPLNVAWNNELVGVVR